jgi:hypothetical protein
VVRLNGTSDILWERVTVSIPLEHGCSVEFKNVMAPFPDVQFYDYTKHNPAKRTKLPANYHLTYSVSDDPASALRAIVALKLGWNVSVVFRKALPDRVPGLLYAPVVDGDETDLRFLERGVIVGLKAKGRAKVRHYGLRAGLIYPP